MSAPDQPTTGDPESDRMWADLKRAQARAAGPSQSWRAQADRVAALTGDANKHGEHLATRALAARVEAAIQGAPGACCYYADIEVAVLGLRQRGVSRDQAAAFKAAVLDLFDHPDTPRG